MRFWWRRHLSETDLDLFAMGHELTREKESRIFEHLTSCPKCLAEYRLAVRIIRAMRVWWETLPRKDQDQFLAKLEALQMAGRL